MKGVVLLITATGNSRQAEMAVLCIPAKGLILRLTERTVLCITYTGFGRPTERAVLYIMKQPLAVTDRYNNGSVVYSSHWLYSRHAEFADCKFEYWVIPQTADQVSDDSNQLMSIVSADCLMLNAFASILSMNWKLPKGIGNVTSCHWLG